MCNYYVIEPEVAGGWGENTKFTRIPGRPVTIHKLHCQFDGWLGDNLVESSPCYIVTDRLAAEIARMKLTGVQFDKVEVSKSGQFDELYPQMDLPKFEWMKIEGSSGEDDFGLTDDLQLIVSQKALTVLERLGVANANVETYLD